MKIIKDGVNKDKKEFHAKCDICGCEFTFIRSEAEIEYFGQRDSDPALKISCPMDFCYNRIYVREER